MASRDRRGWLVESYHDGPTEAARDRGKRTSRDPGLDKKALWKTIDKDQRLAARQKLADLRARIKKARSIRVSSKAEAKAFCHAERLAARARIDKLKLQLREEQKRLIEKERAGARWRCSSAKRAPALEIATLRQALETERRFQQEMRRIAASNRARGQISSGIRRMKSAREVRGESDDEVRGNIPADLIPLFERIKRQIKPGPRKSRTESFLEYVEANPGEEFHAIEDKTEALVRELERQQRSGRRDPRSRRDPKDPRAPKAPHKNAREQQSLFGGMTESRGGQQALFGHKGQWTVVSDQSRLGRAVSLAEANRIAAEWRQHGIRNVRVISA